LRLRDIGRFAWKAMTDRKLRATLTIIGIVIGPATIVALLGATQGLSNSVSTEFAKTGTSNIYVTALGRGSTLGSTDVSTISSMAGVKSVVPYYSLSGTISQESTQGATVTSVEIVGVNFSQLSVAFPSLSLATGSLPSSSNLEGAAVGYSVAYPGTAGASNLTVNNVVKVSFSSFGGGFGGPVSTSISGSKSFIVTGVYAQYGTGFTISPDDALFVSLQEGQQITKSVDYTGLIVVAAGPSTVSQVDTEITDQYGSTVRTETVSTILSTVQSVDSELGTILASVGGISVLVAFVGIMTTMFTNIIERTREIGILKALGYTSSNIRSAFLIEATITGFLGGVIGAAVGAGLSYFIIGFFSSGISLGGLGAVGRAASSSSVVLTPAISPELILFAVGLATAVGALAGLLPAWRASRLVPVQALRSE
jgi:putative ABC transport system permease protein